MASAPSRRAIGATTNWRTYLAWAPGLVEPDAKERVMAIVQTHQKRRWGIGGPAWRGKRLMIFLAIGPMLLYYLLWLVFPIAYSFVMSFSKWNPLIHEQTFLGLGNYREALFHDKVFWTTLFNSAYFSLVTVVAGAILGLVVAMAINALPRFVPFFRTLYFLPVVSSMVAVSIIWRWIYQPRFGLINTVLAGIGDFFGFGMPEINWLGNLRLALPAIMIMSIWKGLGYTMVLFMAGLDAIPRTFYEAAAIDGAGRWHSFVRITLPLLKPTIAFVLVTRTIVSLQSFTQMYIMTAGGPVNATRTTVMLLYEKAFGSYLFGYASAIAFILFVVILVLTVAQLIVMRTSWEY
jgi:multiple sugar transport system permease protein